MERDLLEVEDSALVEATSFHLASVSAFAPFLVVFVCLSKLECSLYFVSFLQAMMLSRSLHRQDDLYRCNIEGKKAERDRRIKELDKLKKKLPGRTPRRRPPSIRRFKMCERLMKTS